ncbi:ABC transporter permease [Pseudoxanthobacter sp.]|uniref:ABC transporter permease n=1 Tax=Pseudoxanthobacter sp. TaxID=1925742 RepID=UPI002FE180FE
MIPFHLIAADLKRLWVGGVVIVLLIAFATALGVAVTLQERALRLGSARAADRFDLVVGAPGSETQLVLSAVFLEPAPLPLVRGSVLAALSRDPRVAWAAPVGFGDSFEGLPVVGSTAQFVAAGGALTEGRVFSRLNEAVAGALAPLQIGDIVKPMHGLAGEGGHTHTELAYTVTGRMAPTGTPWDRAILVPIEAVWRIHGLGGPHHDEAGATGAAHEADHGSEADHDHIADHDHETDHDHAADRDAAAPDHPGPPWADDSPGVPAILVKPKSIADAYRLRHDYRRGEGTLAVFPAEVLTRLYATLGDVRSVLTVIALGTEALVAAAVMLVTVVHLSQRRRQIGALRALGAPRVSIFALVWIEILALVAAGIAAGFALGYVAARIISAAFTQKSGVALPVEFVAGDWAFAGLLLLVAAVIAAVPAAMAYRQPAAAALRG